MNKSLQETIKLVPEQPGCYLYYNKDEIINLETKINIFKKYGCSNEFIREILINKISIFKIDEERLKYIFDAIVSNHDIIEETILDIL